MSSSAGRPVEGASSGPSVPGSGFSPVSRAVAPESLGRLFWVGIVAIVVVLVPPVGEWARRFVVGEAVQFSVLAYVGPPLLVLGLAPLTRGRLAAWPAFSGAGSPVPVGTTRPARHRLDPLEDRPGRGAFDPAAARAWAALVVFVGLVALWRSASAVDALARREWLVLLEAATLVIPGCAVWLNIVDSGASVTGAGRPRRMAIAAIAMWSIWVLAFIVGFSGHPMFSAYHHRPGSGLSALGDQELAVAVLWAVPGLALVPVVFANLVSWLRTPETRP